MLTVNMNNISTKTYSNDNKSFPLSRVLILLVDSTRPSPWIRDHLRAPWTFFEVKHLKGMNFFITVNPDPDIDYYKNTKKFLLPLMIKLMEKLKRLDIISKYCIIYEWGKLGKQHGKLHFHGFIKTKMRFKVFEEVNKTFNKRSNLRHRTTRIDYIKSLDDRDRMLSYCKKEQQNKLKCLFYN